jgi:hypothetical protein
MVCEVGCDTDLAQEAAVLISKHGQREKIEVEGLRLIVAAIPAEEGQPILAHQEVFCTLSQLQGSREITS